MFTASSARRAWGGGARALVALRPLVVPPTWGAAACTERLADELGAPDRHPTIKPHIIYRQQHTSSLHCVQAWRRRVNMGHGRTAQTLQQKHRGSIQPSVRGPAGRHLIGVPAGAARALANHAWHIAAYGTSQPISLALTCSSGRLRLRWRCLGRCWPPARGGTWPSQLQAWGRPCP